MNGTTKCKADAQETAKDLRYLARLVIEHELSPSQLVRFIVDGNARKIRLRALCWVVEVAKDFPAESYLFLERCLQGFAYFMEEPR